MVAKKAMFCDSDGFAPGFVFQARQRQCMEVERGEDLDTRQENGSANKDMALYTNGDKIYAVSRMCSKHYLLRRSFEVVKYNARIRAGKRK